jgi:hypothetical protein
MRQEAAIIDITQSSIVIIPSHRPAYRLESVKKSGVKLPEFELLGTTMGLTFRKTARKINSLMYDS